MKFPATVQFHFRGKYTPWSHFTQYSMKSGANHKEETLCLYVRLCGQYIKLRPVSGSVTRFFYVFTYFLLVFDEELYDGNLFRISSSESLMWSLLQWQKILQNKYTSGTHISHISYMQGEDTSSAESCHSVSFAQKGLI
jgi:hypothetical protein